MFGGAIVSHVPGREANAAGVLADMTHVKEASGT